MRIDMVVLLAYIATCFVCLIFVIIRAGKGQPKTKELDTDNFNVIHLSPGDTVFWQPSAKRESQFNKGPARWVRKHIQAYRKLVPDGVNIGYLAPGDKLKILKEPPESKVEKANPNTTPSQRLEMELHSKTLTYEGSKALLGVICVHSTKEDWEKLTIAMQIDI